MATTALAAPLEVVAAELAAPLEVMTTAARTRAMACAVARALPPASVGYADGVRSRGG